VPPQGTTILDVLAEFVHDDPYRLYTILIEADLDGDGEFEPLFSHAVQEVVQGQLDIEQVADAGAGSQAVISWSGIGTLEFTPFPGSPWNDVPGFLGPPYIVPMSGPAPGAAPMQFFRLRQ
jgi:hypothetical protein